ncbi:unnamed protein product [Prorocentrum cordatum]|uniref:Uncharacterized protein n=1 Tax=Prorocentrum cordatum TaxID=2364126 RepID=A0ABN9X459_9DINO|nr:unnamed protein product [Polarella glacialis]
MFWRCQLAPPPLQARTPRGCARGAGAWCMQIVGGSPPLARCPVATEAGTAAARSALHGRAPRPRLGPAPAPGSRGPVAVRELLLGPCLGRQFRGHASTPGAPWPCGAMSLQDCARLSARSENLAEPLQRTRRNKKRKIEEMP